MSDRAARQAAWRRGRKAEEQVAEHLSGLGYSVLDRNFLAGGGELDLVVEREGAVRFVEVKARAVGTAIDPLESITRSKQRHLANASNTWMARNPGVGREFAFMIVTVSFDGTVEIFDDAFSV